MGAEMKGLQQFIADLRGTNSREEHNQRINTEIVNIQKQFNQNDRLNGYQKKKYVTKLIYIYLLSSCNISAFNVTFGTKQCLELVSSKIYSEKYIGYLSIALLFSSSNKESSEADFTNLITNSIKNDLASPNEEFNSLALQCIGTLGNSIWAEILLEDVFQILRSPTSSPLLKKRSALALLKLAKTDKTLLASHPNWIPRILALSDDRDLGVILSVLPLIQFIALEVDFEQVQSLIPTFSKKLSLLILETEKVPKEYFFGKLANPWLIVKISKILTILIPEAENLNIDLTTLKILRDCVSRVIEFTTKKVSDSAVRNAHNAVLFAMIDLAGLLNPTKEALISSIDAVSSLLDSNELNTRYLALNSLITLTTKNSVNTSSQKHLLKIFSLLKEQDISIAKKSLDLIYILADLDSIEYIVEELLKILKISDQAIKQEIAIKISVLCEKFATTPSWFVNTMLELIDNAGTSLDESIWERVVQIIVNNESLQEFTCLQILKYITKSKFSEPMVKITAYILGEFGYLIKKEVPIHRQFEILTNIYFYVSNNTKIMILTTFMKLFKLNLDDKLIKSNIIKLLSLEVNSINLELQQRAFEYLTLIQKINTNEGKELYNILFAETPVFNTSENKLLIKLAKRNPTPNVNSKITENLKEELNGVNKDLINLDLDDNDDPFSHEIKENKKQVQTKSDGPLTPNWQHGFFRLFEFNQGVFFENSLIKIILRIKPNTEKKDINTFHLTFTNKSPQDITSFIISLTNYKTVNPDIIVNLVELPENDLMINAKTSCELQIVLRSPNFKFDEIPNLRIQFNTGGAFNSIRLKLPIFLIKFLKPTRLVPEQFNQHWNLIDSLGTDGESQKIIKSKFEVDGPWLERFIEKLGLSLVDITEEGEIYSSGIVHSSSKGNFGVLFKALQLNNYEIKFTVRVTTPKVGELIMESLVKFFSH